MPYYNAVLQNDPNVSETLRGLLRGVLDAHAAWEFVETHLLASYNYDVYRSLGTANGLGADYYVILRFHTTTFTTSIQVTMAEEYDTGTHTASKVAPTANSSTSTPAADGSHTATGVLLTATTFQQQLLSVSSTLTEYFISLTDKRLVFATRVGTTPYGVYAGQFEPFWSGDTMPIVIGNPTTTVNQGAGSFTRQWAKAGVAVNYTWATTSAFVNNNISSLFSSVGAAPDFYADGKWTFTRGVIAAYSNTQGGVRGEFYGIIAPYGTTGIAVGDTVTVDGVVYVYLGLSTFLNTAD